MIIYLLLALGADTNFIWTESTLDTPTDTMYVLESEFYGSYAMTFTSECKLWDQGSSILKLRLHGGLFRLGRNLVSYRISSDMEKINRWMYQNVTSMYIQKLRLSRSHRLHSKAFPCHLSNTWPPVSYLFRRRVVGEYSL